MKKLLVCALVAAFALVANVGAAGRGKQGPDAVKRKAERMAGMLKHLDRMKGRLEKAAESAQGEDKEILGKALASLSAAVEKTQAVKKAVDAGDMEGAEKAMREAWKAQRESRSQMRMAEMVMRVVRAKDLAGKLADKPEAAAKAKALVEMMEKRLALEKQVIALDQDIQKSERELKGAGRERRPKKDRKGKGGRKKGRKGRKKGKGGGGDEAVIE